MIGKMNVTEIVASHPSKIATSAKTRHLFPIGTWKLRKWAVSKGEGIAKCRREMSNVIPSEL